MKKIEVPINTPHWLRTFKGCEDLTDDEALEVIDSLKCLAVFLLNSTPDNNGILIDNQLVVDLKQKKIGKINRAA